MTPDSEKGRLTTRAIIMGIALSIFNAYWVAVMEVRWYVLDGTCLPLFVTPVFVLLLLSFLNYGAQRITPRWALLPSEILTIYVMMVVSCAMAGHDTIANLIGTIGHLHQHASRENQWLTLFGDLFPEWMWVSDKETLTRFYEGGKRMPFFDFFSPAVLRGWMPSLAIWLGFFAIATATMLSIALVLRRSWIEHERLSFPIIQLPIAVTRKEPASVLTCRLFWVGFGIAAFISIVNGLNVLYPSVPRFNRVKLVFLRDYFAAPPWNAMDARLGAYPFGVGLAYFLPTDLSFSCWFFFLLRTGQQVFRAHSGLLTADYFGEQSMGAWLVLVAVLLTSSWRQLRGLSRRAVEQELTREPGDVLRRKLAIAVAITGFCAMVAFAHYAGLRLFFAILFFALYFGLAIAITRVRAEMGAPHEIYFVQPRAIIATTFGSNFFINGAGPFKGGHESDLAIMSSFFWLTRGNRNHPMPNYLEALKIGQTMNMPVGSMTFVLVLGTVVSIISAAAANLHIPYFYGGVAKLKGFKNWVGAETFQPLQDWLTNPRSPSTGSIKALLFGASMALLLSYLRVRFVGIPFHPAGYALATSFALDYFWFSFFVAWLIKAAILRWGGQRAHRNAAPFFLGLIAGDYFLGAFWSLYGMFKDVAVYQMYI